METYPAHVVVAWIGNSEAVARKHYLQVTAGHFEKAAETVVATQVAQKGREMEQTEEPTKNKTRQKHSVFGGFVDEFAK